MQIADLKIGMYLHNESKKFSLPLYGNPEGENKPVMMVAPGQLIGQIVDFSSGTKGPSVVFTSERINKRVSFWKKAGTYIFPVFYVIRWLEGKENWGCGVPFEFLKRLITDAQIAKQAELLAKKEAEGNPIANGIKKVFVSAAEIVSETAEALIPWKLLLAAAGAYVLINWSTFKPSPKK